MEKARGRRPARTVWTAEHGRALEELRLARGYTREGLAEASGGAFGDDAIEKWEYGKNPPSPKNAKALAAALGVSVDDLGRVRLTVPQRMHGAEDGLVIDDMLPPVPEHFVGREEDRRRLLELLHDGHRRVRDGESICVVRSVRGVAGIGKTSFAAFVARDAELQASSRGGVFWASLGMHPQPDADMGRWAEQLGDPELRAEPVPSRVAERFARLLKHHALFLLDDVWNAADIAPYRRAVGERGTLIVLTRRTGVAEDVLSSSRDLLELHGLTPDDARALLARLVEGFEVLPRKPLDAFCEHVEFSPLALYVGGRLLAREMRRGFDPVPLLKRLATPGTGADVVLDQHAPLDVVTAVSGTPRTVRDVLDSSVASLPEPVQQRFAFLAGLPARPASISSKELAKLWGVKDARPTIEALTDAGLLETAAVDRYQAHALTIALARARCEPSL